MARTQARRPSRAHPKIDNAFVWIEDLDRAQRRADRFAKVHWPTILNQYANRVTPQVHEVLKASQHDWVRAPSESATDILFKTRQDACELYPQLLPTNAKRDLYRVTTPEMDTAGRRCAGFNPLARHDTVPPSSSVPAKTPRDSLLAYVPFRRPVRDRARGAHLMQDLPATAGDQRAAPRGARLLAERGHAARLPPRAGRMRRRSRGAGSV